MDLDRHFTATGIILHNRRALLIEHAKLGWWLPPGGHLEPNEDPVQAVLREVAEETGLECALLAENRFAHEAVQVLPVPFTIQIEDVTENGDMMSNPYCANGQGAVIGVSSSDGYLMKLLNL